MATASVSITPECSICFEILKTPKILSCGHTFCLCCIEKLIGNKNETFPCPLCMEDVGIPEGGAKQFITNFIVETTQAPPATHPTCPNHNKREVDYYCNNCNVGLCSKCIIKQHKDHETLDIEHGETRNKAIEKLERSKQIIKNRIKNLEKTRFTLLESFEQLKSGCEDSCAKLTAKTQQIVSDLQTSCEHMIKDVRAILEENRIKVEDTEMEIASEIHILESNMESNISPSTATTLNILFEIEKLDESRKDHYLCLQYLQWVEKDFSSDIDQFGSVISKSYHIPGSYQFIFDISDIEEDGTEYYSSDKFRNNNLVWSCRVGRFGDDLGIGFKLLPDDNPELDYCIIDGHLSLLDIGDDSETITRTFSERRVERGGGFGFRTTWSDPTNKNNDYLQSNGQFVVQFDLKQIREIDFSQ